MNKKVKEMCEKALKLYYNELANAQLLYKSYMTYQQILEAKRNKYIEFYSTLFDLGLINVPEREAYITEVYTAHMRVTQ